MKFTSFVVAVAIAFAVIGCAENSASPTSSANETIVVSDAPVAPADKHLAEIVAINYEALTGMFINEKGENFEFYVDGNTLISRNGAECGFTELAVGDKIIAKFEKDGYATIIEARGDSTY